MNELVTQMGPAATTLVALVAGLVQQLKRIPAVNKWQEMFPVYQVASYGLGIAGAFTLGLSNPIFAGVLVGLAANGAYDAVKKIEGKT